MKPRLIIVYQWNGSLVTVKEDMTNLAKICIYRHFGSYFDDLDCPDHDMSQLCKKYRKFRGKSFAEFIRNVLPDAEEDQVQACADEFAKMQQEFDFKTVAGYSGISWTITQLHRMHAKQAISTHYPQDRVLPWVGKKNLGFAIEQVMGGESGSLDQHLADIRLKNPNHKIVLVSDKLEDMSCGADYKVGFITSQQFDENPNIAKQFKRFGANQTITRISNLIPFVSKLKEILISDWA